MYRACRTERALGTLALAFILGQSLPAVAQTTASEPTPEQVRAAAEAFDLGRQSYKDGRFAEAAEQFERADASAPSATALELALRSRDKAGDLDRAGTLAALALTLYPNDENIARIAPDVVARAQVELFELAVTCSEACEIADGNKIVHGAASSKRTLFLAAGTHHLRVSFGEGRSAAKDVEATAGGSGSIEFAPTAPETSETDETPPPPAPEPEPPPPAPKPKAASGLPPLVVFIGAGATAVAGGVTIWSGIDTVNNPGADKVKALCAAHDENCSYYKDGRAKQTRTNVLLGATGVLGVATGVLALVAVDWSSPHAAGADQGRRAPRITPYFAWARGPSVGARGSF